MPRKRRRKAGNLDDLTRVLWQVILEVEALLDTRPPSNDLIIKSAHALAQLAGAYRAVIETTDLEARLSALEQSVERNGHVP
jgi:hypothetical protein